MKQGYYILLFALLLGYCLIGVRIEQFKYDRAWKERERIENAMQKAIEYAADCAAEEYSTSEDSIREIAKTAFFESLYVSFEALGNAEKMQYIELCIPAFAVVGRDGVCFSCLNEAEEEVLNRIWSERYPYLYETENFSYQFFLDDTLLVTRKADGSRVYTTYKEAASARAEWTELRTERLFSSTTAYLERKREAVIQAVLTGYEKLVSIHNRIAGKYGVRYVYTVPDFLQEYMSLAEQTSFLAIVQGWPLTESGMEFYESCVETGSYVKQSQLYCLELPASQEQPYAVFHKSGC